MYLTNEFHVGDAVYAISRIDSNITRFDIFASTISKCTHKPVYHAADVNDRYIDFIEDESNHITGYKVCNASKDAIEYLHKTVYSSSTEAQEYLKKQSRYGRVRQPTIKYGDDHNTFIFK